uniref:FBA_2 domain-containing protein n=1 Tax=Caenorhabditis tropicalis TaxID=1561998 RepID=A0A1I7TUL5_9PELO
MPQENVQVDVFPLLRLPLVAKEHVLCMMTPFELNNFRLEIPEGLDRLEVNRSKFINYEHLLRVKARNIVLKGSILTNQEINRFLKSWMACESHLDLESFKINASGFNPMKEIIMDVPHEVAIGLDAISEKFPSYITLTSGYNIKRSDGKEATVCLSQWYDMFLLIH